MKNTRHLSVLFILTLFCLNSIDFVWAQSRYPVYNGAIIPITSFTVLPENCAADRNGVEKLNDGINYGDYNEFHTPWGGMQKQDVVIEGVLDGKGKVLNELVLEQRFSGKGGLLKTGSLWVKVKNKFQKVADIDLPMTNAPIICRLSKPIKNPQGVKLIINDAYSDNGNYMVCLGEMTCLMDEESLSNQILEIDTLLSEVDKYVMRQSTLSYIVKNNGAVGMYTGDLIPIKNLSVTPAGCAAVDNDVDKLVDGKNFGEKTQFHTPWKGMPKQTVTIEGTLDGAGKVLNEIVLDQRLLGTGGIIRQGSIWIMSKGVYTKVAKMQLSPVNVRVRYLLKKPIRDPQKIRLIVNEAFPNNLEYVVCLGELACITNTEEGFARVNNERNQIFNEYKVALQKKLQEQVKLVEQQAKLMEQMKNVAPYMGEKLLLRNFKTTPDNCAAPDNGPELLADGLNFGERTEFHTPWSGMEKQVVTIEADIDGKGKRLDQIVLDQRFSGEGGLLKKGSFWVMTNGIYQKVEDFDLKMEYGRMFVEPDVEIRNPEKVKLIIDDAYSDNGKYMVCVGELACISLPDSIVTNRITKIESSTFGDLLGLTLRKGFRRSDLEGIKIEITKAYAEKLLQKTYKPGSLMIDIKPSLDPDVIHKKMNAGKCFSKFEGVTGVVLKKGPNLVFVGKTNGAKLKLLQPVWSPLSSSGADASQGTQALKYFSFTLKEGLNCLKIPRDGLVYVQYFTEDAPENHAPVTVHFPMGEFNGYFDLIRGDTDADFNALLNNAIFPTVDIKGRYVQAAFPVEALKKYTYNKGVLLLNSYDTIVGLHRKFIGWDKEGFTPKNHILARVNLQSFMYCDIDGVSFINTMLHEVVDPKVIHNGNQFWGFVHETGHVFQMRPQMTWGGMVEVSNNIASMYIMNVLGNGSRLGKEKQYEAARKNILDKGISYLGTTESPTNYFQRLVPFWQLYLYFKQQGNPDFYADLMIAMRQQKGMGFEQRTQYKNMLEFCRLACQVSGTDLTEFFERWGFFYVGRVVVQDYGTFDYDITQAEVNAVKMAIAKMKLPKPKVDITTLED